MSVRRVAAGALVVALLSVTACSGDDEPTKASDTTTSDEPTEPTQDAAGDLPEGFGDGPEGSGLDRFYDQEVAWTDCDTSNECANVWVPLDYSDPDGLAITLKVKRQSSRSGDPRGSLLINPGGPGGSGIDYLGYANFDAAVVDAYDIVGFDPRGVATSTPVDCLSDSELDAYVASDPSPDTPDEVAEFEDTWSTYVQGCQDRSGPLLGHVSTVEVARDLDILRALLGDDKLNYFGASYGTYIGAVYAGIFPDHVDRMVLDGAVDPESDPLASQLKQVQGFETALTAYLEDCVAGGDCPMGDDVDSARDAIIDLFNGIDEAPLETTSGRELTEGLAFLGFVLPLYSKEGWATETLALQEAMSGRGDTLLALSDAYTDRAADGTYNNNSLEVQNAVTCLDRPQNESVDEIEADEPMFLAKAPVFGGVGAWFPYGCSNWPLKASEPLPDFSATGAPPILVVGTTRDPATPYKQAVRLAAELDSGVLLSRDGDGHTAYGQGNDCINAAIDTYLVDGTPPDDGTMC